MSPMPCPPGAAGASAATAKRCCRAKKRPSGISATKAFGDTALHKKKPRSRERGLLLPKASAWMASPSTCPPCRARRERQEHLRQQRIVFAERINHPPGSPPPRPSVIPHGTRKAPLL